MLYILSQKVKTSQLQTHHFVGVKSENITDNKKDRLKDGKYKENIVSEIDRIKDRIFEG